jgi:hypothetical protein
MLNQKDRLIEHIVLLSARSQSINIYHCVVGGAINFMRMNHYLDMTSILRLQVQ